MRIQTNVAVHVFTTVELRILPPLAAAPQTKITNAHHTYDFTIFGTTAKSAGIALRRDAVRMHF